MHSKFSFCFGISLWTGYTVSYAVMICSIMKSLATLPFQPVGANPLLTLVGAAIVAGHMQLNVVVDDLFRNVGT